jgi:threonine/homoserine/homoserine lactone efflux protein
MTSGGATDTIRGMPIDPQLLALFTLTTLIAMITPGPDMLFVRRRAVRRRIDVTTGGILIGLGVRLAVDR